VIGAEFTAVLRAAQHGDESAFVRLWRDANPVMVRYLRVVSTGDPYDIACESWITAIRGLTGFRGDEVAWRSWLFASARLRAEDEGMQRVWHAFERFDDLPEDELEEPLDGDEMGGRGLDATLRAIAALPPGQGEILMLRLAAGLPPATVAHVVGSDVATVRVCERRALERLGTDADLIAWSLAAGPLPAELADEGAVLATLHAIVPAVRQQSAKTLRLPVSRMAGIGTAAAAVGVFGLGGVSAAAYRGGVLPDPVQSVMAKVINAPHPTEIAAKAREADGPGGGKGRTSPSGSVVGPGTTAAAEVSATTRSAAATAAAGLCRAWAADERNGVTGDRSAAYRKLVAAAGGEDRVVSYCATMLLSATSAIKEGTSTEPGTKPTTQTRGGESATVTPPGIGTPSTGTTTPDTTTDTTTPDTTTDTDTATPGPTEPGPTEPGTTAPPDPPTSNDTGNRPSKTKTNTHGPSSSTSGTSGTTAGTTTGTTSSTTTGATNGTTRTKGSTGMDTTTGADARAHASDETVPAGSTAGSPRSDSRDTGRARSTTPTN
jgi:DNA-directed RNA polymerase specialized sigma24 family protein